MKENRLGPRQWAFVVVAGGAVLALPFMQRQPAVKPESVVDVQATLLPEVDVPASTVAASPAPPTTTTVSGSTAVANMPVWPTLPHSPFDELVQQKAVVPDAKPTEEIVPMHPLRPWIAAPNLTSSSLASTPSTGGEGPTSLGKNHVKANSLDAMVSASPWRDDASDDDQATNQVVRSYGNGRRQLPVTAGPADQYTYEEIAQKLNLPKEDLASAIMPPEQVLPVPGLGTPPTSSLAAQGSPTIPKSSVVLSRQPAARPVVAAIRFGQANATAPSSTHSPAMTPLPKLPEERRGHIIMQPRRP